MVTLVFSRGAGPLSRFIMLATRGRASHAMIGLELYGVEILLHATIGGVQATTRAKKFKSCRFVAEYEILQDVSVGVAEALRRLNERFDYVGLLGYIPVLFWRWLGRKIKNPLASPGATVCSEFVMELDSESAPIHSWAGRDPERMTPEDLLRICEADAETVDGCFRRVA